MDRLLTHPNFNGLDLILLPPGTSINNRGKGIYSNTKILR